MSTSHRFNPNNFRTRLVLDKTNETIEADEDIIPQRMQLTKIQNEFFESKAIFRGFTGGRGAGKTHVGALDLICRMLGSPAGSTFMIVAPTYRVLLDTSYKTFQEHLLKFGIKHTASGQNFTTTFAGGRSVLFRSAETPGRLRGKNLSGIWMDEAGEVKKDVFDIIIGCLREGGRQGWLSATFTPKGRAHWTYDTFGKGKEYTAMFKSPTRENVFNNELFEGIVRSQYTSKRAEQELEGNFIDMSAGVFERQWFDVVRETPAALRRVRFWDKAATEDGGCYTVGLLMGLDIASGLYYIEHLVREQLSSHGREQLIQQVTQSDAAKYGKVKTLMEQEPGSGGKDSALFTIKQLSGFNVHASVASGSKVERAQPCAAQAEAGNVKVKEAPWNEEFLDELASFPEGKYADQVDATTGAFNDLALNNPRKFNVWV